MSEKFRNAAPESCWNLHIPQRKKGRRQRAGMRPAQRSPPPVPVRPSTASA